MELSGTMTGLAVSVCGQIGLIVMEQFAGVTIGPPFANAYAVEPVGVEMMIPSPVKVARNSLFTYVSILITRDAPYFATTMSFRAGNLFFIPLPDDSSIILVSME